MAVNKNFVVKNGLEVNTNLLVADLDTQTVGIGTTIAPHELHVVGGIGVTNLNVTGVATIANLRIGGISTFVGFTTFIGDVSVGGALTASTVTVQDLTNDRVIIAGTGGELEDSSNFRFDGSQLILGVGATVGGGLTVAGKTDLNSHVDVVGGIDADHVNTTGVSTFQGGSIDISNAIRHLGDPNTTISFPSADTFKVETGGTDRLTIGPTGVATFSGAIDANNGIDASTAKVEDLTSGRVVLAGTGGELEDSGNLTFDGTQLVVTGVATVSGAMTAGSFSVGNNQVISSARELQNIASLDSTTTATIESAIANAPNTFTDLQITGIATFKNDVQFHGVAGITSISFDKSDNSLKFVDNAKAKFGTGDDLQIYHTGSHSYIADASGTGDIVISSNKVRVVNAADNEDLATFTENGSVDLYYDNSKKLETTGFGATVFGQLKTQQFLAGVSTFTSNVGIAESIFHVGDTNTSFGFPAADTFTVDTGGSERLRIDSNGEKDIKNGPLRITETYIAFTGNSATPTEGAAIFRPAADTLAVSINNAERLRVSSGGDVGIGTTNPERRVEIHDTAATVLQLNSTNANGTALRIQHNKTDKTFVGLAGDFITGQGSNVTDSAVRASGALLFATGGGTERLRVTSGGLVGINTIPGTLLELRGESSKEADVTFNRQPVQGTNDGVIGQLLFENNTDSVAQISVKRESAADDAYIQFATQATGGGMTEALRITSAGDVDFKGANGITSMSFDRSSNSLDFVDNAKAQFGTGDDLQIYHNGTVSRIDNNVGVLQIRNLLDDSDISLQTDNGSGGAAEYVLCDGSSGSVLLKHYGNTKFETGTDGVIATGIVTATGGFALGIHSAGTSVVSGPVKTLNFVGTGNTFAYNASTDTIDISIAGGSGGGGSGVTETDTTVSTTNPTGVGSFATASFRSASVIAQINQLNTDFQVGRYLMIHDGTTVTVVEESAVSTGSTMLGSFTGVIDGSNVELRVTLASAGVSTVTTKIDTVTV